MAKPAPAEAEPAPPGTKPSMKLVALTALIMALVGGGAGFGIGFLTSPPSSGSAEAGQAGGKSESEGGGEELAASAEGHDAPAKNDAGAAGADREGGSAKSHEGKAEAGEGKPDSGDGGGSEAAAEGESAGRSSVSLEPVVTNISAPSDVWIRFESVLKISAPVPKETSEQIHQDFLAFFRTMRLEDLQGASAFNDLKAELLARANTRADGKVDSIIVKTFLFE